MYRLSMIGESHISTPGVKPDETRKICRDRNKITTILP